MKPKINCDLCKKEEFTKLYDVGRFDIVRCDECGLVFRNVILDKHATKELYSEKYFTDEQKKYFFDNDQFKRNEFAQKIRAIEKMKQGGGDT